MSEPTPGAAEQAPPVCPRHPDRVSYVRCQRCERPTCPQCQVPAPVGVLCVDCARAADQAARSSRNSLGFKRGSSKPYLTYGLIAANVVFYLYGMSTGMREWQITYGFAPVLADEWYRWITSGFVHAGLLHIALNMYMLFQFGTQLEQVIGRWRFAVLYVISLIGGSVTINMLGASNSLHVGASGAIFGLFAAFGLLLYKLKLPWQSLAMTAGIWLVAGFFISGISWEGHLGGAIAGGAVMGAMLALRRARPQP